MLFATDTVAELDATYRQCQSTESMYRVLADWDSSKLKFG